MRGVDAARLLIAAGIDWNAVDHSGKTAMFQPMIRCCVCGDRRRTRIYRLLVESGASVARDGATALLFAIWGRDLETAALLLRAGATLEETQQIHAFADVVSAGDVGIVRLLLASGMRPDGSPLQSGHNSDVSPEEHAAAMRVVPDAGAEPNHRGWYEHTPLMALARWCDTPEIELLLAYGARKQNRDAAHRTAAGLLDAGERKHRENAAQMGALETLFEEIFGNSPSRRLAQFQRVRHLLR